MIFSIDPGACVTCLACVRVCPTGAVEVQDPLVRIEDESCIRCGLCLPACPHDAIEVTGELGRAMSVAARGGGVLILAPEAAAHFYPASPEQVVNAAYAAGFRMVNRGVLGDELIAAEYLRLWREPGWGTLLRSTDPVVVDTIRRDYPELVPYLAPVTIPTVAEARYLRSLFGESLEIVFAGVCPPAGRAELDAAVTFRDLEQLFKLRGVAPQEQPNFFVRVPSERRRHLSTAGGLPIEMLQEAAYASRRFRKVRGLKELRSLARAITVDRLDLGFVDLLSHEGWLDHPLSGPPEELFWRRSVVESTEPQRSRYPVVDGTVAASPLSASTAESRSATSTLRAWNGGHCRSEARPIAAACAKASQVSNPHARQSHARPLGPGPIESSSSCTRVGSACTSRGSTRKVAP